VSRGVVAVYPVPGSGFINRHERATHEGIARRLAALKGFSFVGEFVPGSRYPAPVYLVPSDTLVGLAAAEKLGMRGEQDLFGGVVPDAFVATKAITHPLVGPDATSPPGWSPEFGQQISDTVLSGFSAFTLEDARLAGLRLLERGPIRLKSVRATGGRGQVVVATEAALAAELGAMETREVLEHGPVLEEALEEVTTYSIGQLRVADLVATYWGTQRLTPDNEGAPVYGGSELCVARGDFVALLGLSLPEEARLAVAQARTYDDAAFQCFAGMFASRRNYDVARGRDASGRARCGVLEQSWRIGGASGAEIASLEVFQADPAVNVARTCCVEIYGVGNSPPPQATVYFHGVDERVGPITKYAMVQQHGDA
jgi:Protein of unknown function (DUF3182)